MEEFNTMVRNIFIEDVRYESREEVDGVVKNVVI